MLKHKFKYNYQLYRQETKIYVCIPSGNIMAHFTIIPV